MMINCYYMQLQLQGLIHLALENMTSLFGSLTSTVDEMIPSLRKLRKLAGAFLECPLPVLASSMNSDWC